METQFSAGMYLEESRGTYTNKFLDNWMDYRVFYTRRIMQTRDFINPLNMKQRDTSQLGQALLSLVVLTACILATSCHTLNNAGLSRSEAIEYNIDPTYLRKEYYSHEFPLYGVKPYYRERDYYTDTPYTEDEPYYGTPQRGRR